MNEDITTVEQKPSIKLIKLKTYYNWEIRITSLDVQEIKKINDELIALYGNIKEGKE